MRFRAADRESTVGRRLRELWPDANPLRRSFDRTEAWILGVLFLLFLTTSPVAAALAGSNVYGSAIQAQRTSRRVTATLLSNARPLLINGKKTAAAPASWTAPDGVAHLGAVLVPDGAKAASVVRIWVDAAGQPTGVPLRGPVLIGDVAIAVLLAFGVLGAPLLGVGAAVRWILQRRRIAAWDADWRSTQPRWIPGR